MPALDHSEATVAAIATPPGTGGIGIIRISGRAARAVLKRLFRPFRTPCPFTSHRLYYGHIVNPETQAVVDEVLAVCMRSPHTYTREDVVEIHCHGSYLVLQQVLALTLTAGAVPAAAGEFTKRAFLHGRIDLTRAEAVLEILAAKTGRGLTMAMNQLQGRLYDQVMAIRAGLLHVRAVLEVAIDFPDEEADILRPAELAAHLRRTVQEPLDELIASCERGRIVRDGISAVILGRPNVGKSSLLNCLLREERAIVTEIPGTTRDTIEEYLDIRGLAVRIIDTAGIRTAEGAVEELGIKRSRQKLKTADLVLLLLDAAAPVTDLDRELYAGLQAKPHLLVINKTDIAPPAAVADICQAFPGEAPVAVSARTAAGLAELEAAIHDQVSGKDLRWDTGLDCLPNQRHRAAFGLARAAVQQVTAGLANGLPPDLLAIDLRSALDHLAVVVGETTIDDLLDHIFTRFCIGK